MRDFRAAAAILCASLWLAPATGAADPQDDAIEILNTRNIPYTRDEFLSEVRVGDVENVKVFLDAGMDPNAQDDAGAPALYLAAQRNQAETVKALLGGKALPNLKNARGWTPLLTATLLGFADTVNELLAGGADPNVGDPLGVTPVMLAAQQRNLPILEALLARKADPLQKAGAGQSAVSIAVALDDQPILTLLAKSGFGEALKRARQALARENAAEDQAMRSRDEEHKRKKEALLRAVRPHGGAGGGGD